MDGLLLKRHSPILVPAALVSRADAYVMSNQPQQIVQKLWNFCNVLRDDGLSYGDYVEQLTLLLFLKMAHERTQPPWRQASVIPAGFDWPTLTSKDGKDGDELEIHYRHVLKQLGKKDGMLGIIFREAQNKIQDRAKLKRLISDLIDREKWSMLDADVKGYAYEGLSTQPKTSVEGLGVGNGCVITGQCYSSNSLLVFSVLSTTRPPVTWISTSLSFGSEYFKTTRLYVSIICESEMANVIFPLTASLIRLIPGASKCS